MTDKIKLTEKQLEALSKARRIATGEDMTLDPRKRLQSAGVDWFRSEEITVAEKNPYEKSWSGYYGYRSHSGRQRIERGQFALVVVDAEVFLDGSYNGYAFGKHDPYFDDGYSREIRRSPAEQPDKRDSILLLKADKVAKTMQAVLEEQGEPIPSREMVRTQKLQREINRIQKAIRHLENATVTVEEAESVAVRLTSRQITEVADDLKEYERIYGVEIDMLTSVR